MTIHQFNEKMLPDKGFVQGHIEFLVEGNSCRLLNARRTSGFISRELPITLEAGCVLDQGNNFCTCKRGAKEKERIK